MAMTSRMTKHVTFPQLPVLGRRVTTVESRLRRRGHDVSLSTPFCDLVGRQEQGNPDHRRRYHTLWDRQPISAQRPERVTNFDTAPLLRPRQRRCITTGPPSTPSQLPVTAPSFLSRQPSVWKLRPVGPMMGSAVDRIRAIQFHSTPRKATDGVFAALTDERVQTPWITALEERQAAEAAGGSAAGAADSGVDREELLRRRAEQMKKPKRMDESYHRVILPLARDPWLSDTYLNASGRIRLGALFMDLDALAGVVCYKHTGNDPSVANVTAAFDRITIKNPIKHICDLELSGQVTYASGRSSMEISLQVAALGEPDPVTGLRPAVTPADIMLESTCTMVALDAVTKKPINVSPLLVETEEERRLADRGEMNSKRKKGLRETDLAVYTPNDEESELIHRIWKKRMALTLADGGVGGGGGNGGALARDVDMAASASMPTNSRDPGPETGTETGLGFGPDRNIVFMDSTRLQNATIMQPQFRNRHQFMIFGGFLLKQTFELAFCCAASFARTRPSFLSLDPSTFRNPVPVGSVLYLTARVAYTDPQVVPDVDDDAATGVDSRSSTSTSGQTRVQIRVDSFVRNVEHAAAETKPTGTFNYTFLVDRDVRVMPQTYSEYMMYLDARRRAQMADEHALGGDAVSFLTGAGADADAGAGVVGDGGEAGVDEKRREQAKEERLRALSDSITE